MINIELIEKTAAILGCQENENYKVRLNNLKKSDISENEKISNMHILFNIMYPKAYLSNLFEKANSSDYKCLFDLIIEEPFTESKFYQLMYLVENVQKKQNKHSFKLQRKPIKAQIVAPLLIATSLIGVCIGEYAYIKNKVKVSPSMPIIYADNSNLKEIQSLIKNDPSKEETIIRPENTSETKTPAPTIEVTYGNTKKLTPIDPDTLEKIEKDAKRLHTYITCASNETDQTYSYNTILEVVKNARGYSCSLSEETANDIIYDLLNRKINNQYANSILVSLLLTGFDDFTLEDQTTKNFVISKQY